MRDTRLVVSRMAADVPDARSNRPATGLATVPTIPLPTPVKKPWREGGRKRKGGREEEKVGGREGEVQEE